ncbi:MAG: hypothetical protein ACI8UO_006788 [Verrucomicrobiales bacterium]|jgi:hypothetical protein
MPKALCFKCGEIKDQAWAPCGSCLTTPQTDRDLAASLALTEDHFGVPTLQSFGKMIQSGQRPKLSADTEEEFLKLVKESTQRDEAPEHAFETQPVLRFQPTGIQSFVRLVMSLVGLEFLVAFTAISCTLARELLNLSPQISNLLLWCAIGSAIFGAAVMPLVAWKKPESVPSFGWFMTGAYLAGFGGPAAYMIAKWIGA